MPELGLLGTVRGALRNERPYREHNTDRKNPAGFPAGPTLREASYLMNHCAIVTTAANKITISLSLFHALSISPPTLNGLRSARKTGTSNRSYLSNTALNPIDRQ